MGTIVPVKQRTASRLAWGPFVAGLISAMIGVGLQVATEGWAADLVFVLVFTAFGLVGALVASAQPRNAVGWVFVGVAFVIGVAFLSEAYATYSFAVRTDPLPGAVWIAVFSQPLWIWGFGSLLVFLPLLFPDGRVPSPRWRPFARMSAAVLVLLSVGAVVDPQGIDYLGAPNPVGVPVASGLIEWAWALLAVLALGASVSMLIRYRRADRDRRQQIKWFAFAVGLMAAWALTALVTDRLGLTTPLLETVIPAIVLVSLPVGAGIGILRHRLYDIDVVISRALVFAILAGLITAAYVGIVVGIGAAVGRQGNLFLSILATALIAVAFQPLRERARRVADRLVYGKRATPYELLSEFADRLGEAYSIDDVLPRMARLVGEGTGAARARIWLRVGTTLRPAASWPPDEAPGQPMPLEGEELPPITGEDAAFPVRDRGELLGALTVVLKPGESLIATQEKLLSDLAAQAGLILRNVRLIEELRASRQRLVAAQDEERRRLERNIHDGAQQQIIALTIKQRLVASLVDKDPEKARRLTEELRAETQEALDTLRELARGIYPPLLADQGLAAALESQARKSPIPVTVEANGVARYPQEAEAAAYFCLLEALQNVAKYADARSARILLAHADGHLTFIVEDDGKGFDPATTPPGSGLQNMRDRVEALGGTLEVRSAPGQGTTVTGRIPVERDA